MNKNQQNSVNRIRQSAQSIEDLYILESKRSSQRRKHQMEMAYSSLKLHAGKLDLEIPRLGYWYQPEEYVEHARLILKCLEKWKEGKTKNEVL